jgi:5-methylcytosine-specific restriction protein A
MPWEIPNHDPNPKKKLPKGKKKPETHNRPSPSIRGYGRRWEHIRLALLQEEPLCRLCQGPASCVDHIKPLKKGGTNDKLNLQPLCASCHNSKTWHETWGAKMNKGKGKSNEKP